jgi:hypothetical protein
MAESKSAALPLGYAPIRRRPEGPAESGRTIVRAPKRCNGLDCDFATSPKGRAAALSELGGNRTVICGLWPRSGEGGRALRARVERLALFQTPRRPLPCIATSLGSSRRRQPGPKRIRTKMSNRRNPALRRGKTSCDRRRLRASPRGNREIASNKP